MKDNKCLKAKFQSTLERKVDFLYDVTFENGENSILHFTFQNKNFQILYSEIIY